LTTNRKRIVGNSQSHSQSNATHFVATSAFSRMQCHKFLHDEWRSVESDSLQSQPQGRCNHLTI
jgi:hypothetical protein